MGNRPVKENHFRLVRLAEDVCGNPNATVSEVEEAIARCRHAVELCASYPYSYLVLSKLLYQAGHFVEAADAARQCTEVMPELYAAYFLLADSLEACDEFEAAIGARSRVPKHLRADLQRSHERRMAGRRRRTPSQQDDARGRRNYAAENLRRRHPFLVPHGVPRQDSVISASGGDGLSQDDIESVTSPGEADRSTRCVELAPMARSTPPSSTLARTQQLTVASAPSLSDGDDEPGEGDEHDAPTAATEDAEREIWNDREEEFRKALRRDLNLRRWLGGQRRTIPRSAVERTRVRQITEHREKHTRLMARLSGITL